MRAKERKLLGLAWYAYILLMLWLLFGRRMRWYAPIDLAEFMVENLNLEPFHTIKLFTWVLKNSGDANMIRLSYINLFGNVLMFIPLGFFLPATYIKQRKFWRCMTLSTAIILMVELAQLFSRLGTCDVDDLILNLIGCMIGYAIYSVLYSAKKRGENK